MAVGRAHYSDGGVMGLGCALMSGLHLILLYIFLLFDHHGNVAFHVCLIQVIFFYSLMCKGKLNDSLNCIGNTAYTVTLLFAIVIYNLAWDVVWLYCDLQLAELFVVIYSCVRSSWSQKLQRRMSNKRVVWKFYAFFVSLLSMWPWCSVFTCTRSHTHTHANITQVCLLGTQYPQNLSPRQVKHKLTESFLQSPKQAIFCLSFFSTNII